MLVFSFEIDAIMQINFMIWIAKHSVRADNEILTNESGY